MAIANALAGVNWLAVHVAWIVHVVVSLLWFQPVFFGRAWVGLSGKELKPATRWIPVGFAAHFAAVLALALIVKMAGAVTAGEGIAAGPDVRRLRAEERRLDGQS